MTWSAQQREWLDALGYEVLVPGRPEAPPVVAPAGAAAVDPAPPRAGSAAPATSAPSSKLLEALRRAAGGADPTPLVDDLARLRNDPALKRALWPRLRALRRSRQ